ncbi:unnamed protein product [Clonostachys rosea f. rosea IK726]|uniref:Uncharacterized protein n=2 Tax=Bionectria ochroleuca TaxID=29856 RepID=A0A0B7KI06_BIOOC|nr:unnamed protein product [Clonostachys rosea f. rosea IK726]
MCTFTERVSRCGHYTKTLSTACASAKAKKEAYDSDSGTSSTTGGWCYLFGCNKQAGVRRDGPGSRTNSGFDNDDVDWNEY